MAKWHRVGSIQTRKDKKGNYIILGNPNAKKFAYTVDIRIRDAAGEELFVGSNVMLVKQDPRQNAKLTDEQKARIPEFIEHELYVIEQDEQQ